MMADQFKDAVFKGTHTQEQLTDAAVTRTQVSYLNSDAAHCIDEAYAAKAPVAGTPVVVGSACIIKQWPCYAWDGDSYVLAGVIECAVDGTPGDGDMPGKFVFKTTPDGSDTPEEAMAIRQTKAVEFKGAIDVTGVSKLDGQVTVGDGSTSATLKINGAAGQARDFRFTSANSNRWIIRVTNASESGSNAGSNWELIALDDSGAQIDKPIVINRAAGQAITMNRRVNLTGGIREVTDAGPMTSTAGTRSEIVFNTSNSKAYVCTATGSPATWSALN